MDRAASGEFAMPAARSRRYPFLLRRVLPALLALLVIGGSACIRHRTLCGNCVAPIVCAKQCPRLDREIERMLLEQKPKSTDRFPQG